MITDISDIICGKGPPSDVWRFMTPSKYSYMLISIIHYSCYSYKPT